MVFLSTLQALFHRPLTRSVFSFGTRSLTSRIIVEEVAMGAFLVFPASLVVAAVTIRLAAAGPRPRWMRSDIWTTILITIVGDLFLEVLLPSLQCLPTEPALELGYFTWLSQAWGFGCPTGLGRSHFLSTDAVGTLLTIRLIFMCAGIYLGEAMVPIALTGGISCGKSTVAGMLVDPMNKPKAPSSSRKAKKPKHASTPAPVPEEEEGTFLLVDADAIAHQVLLPPSVLAGIDDDGEEKTTRFMVRPQESVYQQVLDTFGGDDPNSLLVEGLIDRTRLGAVVFGDRTKRRQLNALTHPRILLVLLKQILHGIFFTSADIVCADIPLLFESGQLRRLFAIVICVASDEATQFQRLRKRNPELSEQECWERIRSQIPVEQKAKLSDLVIWNNGDLDELASEVERVRRDVIGRVYGIGMSLLQMLLLVGGSLSLAVSSKLFSSWS